jgi:hypothetical protein
MALGLRAYKPDNQTAISELIVETVGSSASHNPVGLHGLVQGWLYFTFLGLN